MADKVRPIYRWRWHRDGYADRVTRSPRQAGTWKRFAAKIGGTVEREHDGYRLPWSLEQLTAEDGGVSRG